MSDRQGRISARQGEILAPSPEFYLIMVFNFITVARMDERHASRPVAQQGPIRVDLCGCGQVHLSIGPLTVRLAPALLQTLRETLAVAATRLPQPAGVELEGLH
jgi:hypothetical protein